MNDLIAFETSRHRVSTNIAMPLESGTGQIAYGLILPAGALKRPTGCDFPDDAAIKNGMRLTPAIRRVGIAYRGYR